LNVTPGAALFAADILPDVTVAVLALFVFHRLVLTCGTVLAVDTAVLIDLCQCPAPTVAIFMMAMDDSRTKLTPTWPKCGKPMRFAKVVPKVAPFPRVADL
jgi:hypothetical protein